LFGFITEQNFGHELSGVQVWVRKSLIRLKATLALNLR